MIILEKTIFLTAFLILIISAMPSLAQTSTYEFEGITSFFDSSDEGVTFSTTDTCQVRMRGTNTFVSASSFDSSVSFRSPDSTTIATSELTGISNTSCLSYGASSIKDVSTDASSGMYESSWSVSQSADSGFATLGTRWICAVNSDITQKRITRALDSRGFCQYRRRAADTDLLATWRTQLQGNYNICGEVNDWIGVACNSSFTSTAANDVTISYIYPFNSSVEGIVNYSFSTSTYIAGSTVFPDIFIDLINTEDGTIQNFHTQDGGLTASITFNAFSDELSLSPNTMFLWMVTYVIEDNGIQFASTINPPELNMSIFTFAGDFVCGEFGACVNGTHSRVCVDQQGIAPDRIETESCFDVPAQTIDLGFEMAVGGIFPPEIYICQQDWGILGCVDVLSTITASFPENWTTSADEDLFTGIFRQNYIRITGDTATVGTKSLQMNYIPPKPSEPINNGTGGTVCGNKTSGDFPFVTTGLNQSLFVSINITFPSPFIQLRWDSRKCSEQILQFDYTGDFLGINCGKRCYAPNCTGEPSGRYRVGLFDSNTLQEIKDTSHLLEDNAWSIENIVDLTNEGLLTGHNYTIIITVNPEEQTGVFDPNAHCVYFDNFRVTITETALPECVTICDPSNPLNLLIAREDGNSCIFRTVINSPQCSPDADTAESFQNFEDVCIETTLHFFNNDTGLWDQIEDNDICISEINETITDTSIVEPLESAEDWLDWILFLVSPLFIFLFISLAVSGAVGALVKAWEGFGITFATMLFVGMLITVPGGTTPVIPIWVGFAMIIVISLMIAHTMRKLSVSGGG